MDFPMQFSGAGQRGGSSGTGGAFHMRDYLNPRRLTIVMWDCAFLLRHGPGGSFEDFDKVLDETVERGYNTVRLDPMPQWVDLAKPERELSFDDPKQPYMAWCWNTAVKGPVGEWLIEFIEKVQARRLNYTLSAWWFYDNAPGRPPLLARPTDHKQAAETWAVMLREWKQRFGFEGLVYVDVANEVPYFTPEYAKTMKEKTGCDWGGARFAPELVEFLAEDLNGAMSSLQAEFPELRFTASIHDDVRWLEVPLEFDCQDVHFYVSADPRWNDRTQFGAHMHEFMTEDAWHAEFSERCKKTHAAVAPMLRARQRDRLAQFAAWGKRRGMPLTTSESWAAWFYADSPNLDWGWLLDWAEGSVEDAIEYEMWGWTPHNYCQPHFKNWQDARWHQRLTNKFLRS
jgi:hypothetical protein